MTKAELLLFIAEEVGQEVSLETVLLDVCDSLELVDLVMCLTEKTGVELQRSDFKLYVTVHDVFNELERVARATKQYTRI